MSITWKIVAMEVAPCEDGIDNVVKVAHYTVDAVDAINPNITATVYGSMNCAKPDPATCIPYEQLDEATVVGWVKAEMNAAEIEAALLAQLEEKKAPKVDFKSLPWVPVATAEPTAESTTTTTA